jgi:cytochrome c-type biogenesis protein CcmH/NrfG
LSSASVARPGGISARRQKRGLLPAATIALYYAVGTPAAINRNAGPEAASPHSAAEFSAAVDEIKTHLQTAPDDPGGWTQ